MNRVNNATSISIQVSTAVNTMFSSYGSSRHSLLSISELQLSEDNVPTELQELKERHLIKQRERFIAITLFTRSPKTPGLHHNIKETQLITTSCNRLASTNSPWSQDHCLQLTGQCFMFHCSFKSSFMTILEKLNNERHRLANWRNIIATDSPDESPVQTKVIILDSMAEL